METLLSKNLIYLASNLGERRFAMLQIIREFALEALAAVDEEMTMRRQHAAYYSLLAQRVATQPPEGEKGQQLRQLEADHDNLRAALEWLIVHEPAGALNLALLLEEFWAARGYDVEAAQRLQAVLKSNPGPIAARASGLLALANVHRRLGDYDAAGLALQSVAQLLESHELNAAIRLKFYRSSGWQHYDLHDYTQTVAYFQKGLALARAENQTSSIIQFLAALAHTQRDRPERHTQVAAYLAEALRLLKTWDDPETLAFVLQQAGGVAVAAEQYDVAGAHYAQMVTIYRRIGNKLGLGWALALVGEVAWFQDDSVTAETQYLEAHAIFYALENLDGIMIMLHHLGQTARRQGRLDEARHYYQQSLLVAEQLHNRHMRARGLAGLSYVALAQGDVAQAAALAGAAQQLFDTLPPFLAIPDQHEFSVLVATIRRDPTPAVAAAWAEGLLLGETSSHKR
ncbi:MAG: tetratricopeptide repeat protein [Caldilineaceae bacterium]